MKKIKLILLIAAGVVLILIIAAIFFITKQGRSTKDTIAVVNGYKIKEAYLEERFKSLPEPYQVAYTNRKDELLEQLIIERTLIQEAERRGLASVQEKAGDDQKKAMELIQKLFDDVTSSVQVNDTEIINFYETNKDALPPLPLEKLRDDIEEYLLAQKQNEVFNEFVTKLREEADVTMNERWVKAQQSGRPEDPLAGVLGNGKPSLIDFGASSCVPCRMMKPILDELTIEYKGKANIVLIEVYEFRELASRYGIRAIPTQIFFDRDGKEVWRHQGYLPKEEIVKKLTELGA